MKYGLIAGNGRFPFLVLEGKDRRNQPYGCSHQGRG
jgi:hypothetical protein